MSLDVDTVRRAIAGLKEHAEDTSWLDLNLPVPADLAQDWWENGDHAGHNDWGALAEETQMMWTTIAQMALREIETGQPTPES